MKILLVVFYFPPFNTVGAVRTGKFAKYLSQAGHEVKVLTVDQQPWSPNLPVEIAVEHIIRTRWINLNKPIELLLGGNKQVSTKGFERAGQMPGILKKLGYLYKDIINFPDGQIGWLPFATHAGKKLRKTWQPEIILASSSPPTTFFVARKLSKQFDVPWVADFRDLWAGNHNADIYQSTLRQKIDHYLERWALKSASGLITVSDPLATTLKQAYDKPVSVIPNGYDLDDYPQPNNKLSHNLRIVYTGLIHPIKRDPTPLFKALKLLDPDTRRRIKVEFYGKNNHLILQFAQGMDVLDQVDCYETVSYHTSLQHQVDADLLLLLTYNSSNEKGVVTTKFFEYLGANRPILLIGCMDGVAAQIIKDRSLGLVENDPQVIADYLQQLLRCKEQGEATSVPDQAKIGFSRREQAQSLYEFLSMIHTDSKASKRKSSTP